MAAIAADAQAVECTLAEAEAAVRTLIRWIGDEPEREGLKDTPRRVARALREMAGGYNVDPDAVLHTKFGESYDAMVVLTGVRFTSLCEHHLLPFVGTVTVGYVPNGRVLGVSKLARLVDCYARRLQIQERMTTQIAEDIMKRGDAAGAGVVVRAHHSCMGCRGVRQPDSEMVTSAMFGVLRDNPEARAELLALTQNGGR